jgi:cell division protein FtsL
MSENTFEREVLDRLTKIEVKLDNYDKLKEQVYENERDTLMVKEKLDNQQKQINSLSNNNKWLVRTIAGACIVAIVGIVFTLVKAGVGL